MRRCWGDIPHLEIVKSRWHTRKMTISLCTRAALPARNSTLPGLSRSGAWVGQQVLHLAVPWEGAVCMLSTFSGVAIVRTHSLFRV